MSPVVEIIIAAIHATSGLLHSLFKVLDDRESLTVEQARNRVSDSFRAAVIGYQHDEADLRERIERSIGDDDTT